MKEEDVIKEEEEEQEEEKEEDFYKKREIESEGWREGGRERERQRFKSFIYCSNAWTMFC